MANRFPAVAESKRVADGEGDADQITELLLLGLRDSIHPRGQAALQRQRTPD